MPRWLKVFLDAAKAWNADNAFKHSASVAFYTLFSLAPVTLIAVGLAGFFFGQESATRQFSTQVGQLIGRESAEFVQKTMEANVLKTGSGIRTAFGVVLMLIGATTVFGQLQSSFNEIWGVTAKPSRSGWLLMIAQRLISFAMVLTIGFLLIASLILTTALTAAVELAQGWFSIGSWLFRVADFTVGLCVITALFALLFKVMPDVKVRWREVTMGALVTAALFSLGRFLIALYLGHSAIASSYGAAGSLVGLLIWIYYSCAILFYGAEYVKAHRLAHGGRIEPKETAVVVRKELVKGTGTLAR